VVSPTPRPPYIRERDPVPIVLEAGWAPGPKRCTSTLSLTSALGKVGGQCHAPSALPPKKRPSAYCIGGWMGPRAEAMYLYSFFNFGARKGGWSVPRPGRLTSEKETRCLLYWRLDGPQGRSRVPLPLPSFSSSRCRLIA